MSRCATYVLIWLFLGGLVGSAHGGLPISPPSIFSSPPGHTFDSGETFSFQLEAVVPSSSSPARVTELEIVGENAAEFSILSEDCTTAPPLSAGETCQVQVRYNGSGGGNAILNATCSPGPSLGSLTLLCDGNPGPLASLFARLVALAIPVMTPAGMTLLALLMFGFMVFHGLRRRS